MESPKNSPRTLVRGKSYSGEWWEIELVIVRLLNYLGEDISTILNFRAVCKPWNHFAIPLVQKLHPPIMLLGAEDGNLIQFLELIQNTPFSDIFPFTKFDMKILINRERCDDDFLESLEAFGHHIEDLRIRLEFGEGIIDWVDEEGLFEHEEKHLNRTGNLKRLEIELVNRIPLREFVESSESPCQAIEEGIKRFLALTIQPATQLEWFKFTVFDLDLDEERDTLEDYVEEEYIHQFYWGDTLADSISPSILEMHLRPADFKDEDWVRLPIRQSRKSSTVDPDIIMAARDSLLR